MSSVHHLFLSTLLSKLPATFQEHTKFTDDLNVPILEMEES